MTRPRTLIHSADLKTLWLLGDPVSHSSSPLIQNRALEALGLPILYLASQVTESDFEDAVRALPKLGALGANVTVPHKQQAYRICDELSERAQQMKAVNTLIFTGQKVKGDNTDGVGWWNSLRLEIDPTQMEQAVVLGAGGAARAITHTLLNQGFRRIHILNRSQDKAEQLQAELLELHDVNGEQVQVGALSDFGQLLNEKTLVVQTTSVGLKGQGSPVELSFDWPQSAFFSELIYGCETPLMKSVAEQGGAVQDGRGMLCGQAAEALSLWLDRPLEEIPLELMLGALE